MNNNFTDYPSDPNAYLMHYGVKGMKWYHRRYQNSDGSLTEAGRRRMGRIEKSRIRSYLQTNSAKGWAEKGSRDDVKAAKYAENKWRKTMNDRAKFGKMYNEAVKNGDAKKAGKYAMLLKEAERQSFIADKAYSGFMTRSNERAQIAKDISSGKLKAGRDFMLANNPWYESQLDYYMITKKKGAKKIGSSGKVFVY